MFCTNCGHEFEGNFCPNCGTAAVQGTESSDVCTPLYDKAGNAIDLAQVLGVYKNQLAIVGYFKRCTDYPSDEIGKVVDYALSNIEPANINMLSAVTAQAKLEAASKPPKEVKPSKKDRIKENKTNGVACCPKCGSTSLSANKKGFGIGKAVVGGVVAGPIGLMAGNINARKVWVTCLNCGHRWKV